MTDTPTDPHAAAAANQKDALHNLQAALAGIEQQSVGAVKAFAQSLLSRKFLAAVGVIVPALLAKRWDVAVTALLGYLGMEGAADVATRVKS